MTVANTITIPCKGGLNLVATNEELLKLPSVAIALTNFESTGSGYRRVDGFAEYGTLSVPGTGEIKGIKTYLGGILCARGTDLYHSFDGATWTKVNKLQTGVNKTTMDAASSDAQLSTTNELPLQIETYTDGTSTHIYIATGNSDPLYLKITGTADANSTYTFREVSLSTELTGARWLVLFENQTILARTDADPTSFIYSSHASTDLTAAEVSSGKTVREKYDGSTAGAIAVREAITGVATYRNALYIFTLRTISRVQGLKDGNPLVVPITTDIGCIDGNTIQEISGDLIFLAADGLRTISATERNSDVDLGPISRIVKPITDHIIANQGTITFASTVIRAKNQYRLHYRDSNLSTSSQKALVAAYVLDATTGEFRWDFSEIQGWDASVVDSGTDTGNVEFNVFGDINGKVHVFESSAATFDGTSIKWTYQTPYIDFGDIGIRKGVHKVFVNMKPEGDVEGELATIYNYQDSLTPQPEAYALVLQNPTSYFGQGVYGLATYGAGIFANEPIHTEGSGHTCSFRVTDTDLVDDPFTVESLQINFVPGGRV